ncbi:zinc-binding dehydrogenase [Pseudonocardia sp. MH-G8]|uniref:zinc-binding dehydrogenase n=1 Tax=Pseudonocardia sp. MH-G8 TaxID=1854588 RepID=UPI001E3F5F20|nr:zinc-binding dehydrogenase [Pseudonocardia sp. MH-G8]
MPTRSRAVVLREFMSPFEMESFEVPAPGEMAAIVDVEYAGICGTDVHLQNGRLPIPTPVVLGHEAVGRVAALGAGLTHDACGVPLAPGDAVSWLNNISCGRCRFCLVEQQPTLCTGSRRIYGINQRADAFPHLSGGWADSIYLQPGTIMVKLPDGVRPRDVIPLGCAGPTAVHGVLDEVGIRPGDVVVVQGSGPVGVAAAIYAQLGGAGKVIMVGGPADRLEQARRLGIAAVYVDVTDGSAAQDRAAAVRAETPESLGADVVIECAGVPSAVAEGIDMCRPGAQYCVLGQYTDHGTTPLNPHLITRKQLRVHGSWGFSARHYITYISSLPRLIARFDLGSLLSEYPLEAADEAVADVKAGAVMKAVLRPGGPPRDVPTPEGVRV